MKPERVKEIREAMGLTQEDFAHKLGTSVSTVNRWENGKNRPGRMATRLLEMMADKIRQPELSLERR